MTGFIMIIATGIDTDLWIQTLAALKGDHWLVTYKYNEFDAGIDFDLVRLERGGEQIVLGWDNWDEGEIKCTEETMRQIERLMGVKFTIGEPSNLKQTVIDIYLKPADEEK
jgi:hypothetical protein